jgi:hypothetical protein
MAHLYGNIDPQIFAAYDAIAADTGAKKKDVLEATIAIMAGLDHPAGPEVKSAWARYRKAGRS